MANELHNLPRLSRLRSFEAAARHLSFTEASRELGITQAAVSQQVRILERELGVPLFVRQHRGLKLTPQGHRLSRSVSTAFDQIADAAQQVRGDGKKQSLRIGVTFAVATFWLMPRIFDFRQLHPDIDVHLIATDLGFHQVADQVDIGIAYGKGVWPEFSSSLLCDCMVFPVCSPAYSAAHSYLTEAEQLTNETLLSIEQDRPGRLDWEGWFAALGIDAGPVPLTFKVNSHPLLVQAACEGRGIALGWTLLTDDLIANGRLVRPIRATVRSRSSFYFVSRPDRQSETIDCFRDWIFNNIENN